MLLLFFRTVVTAILLSLVGCSHSFGFLCNGYSSRYARQGDFCNRSRNVAAVITSSDLESKPAAPVVAETMTKEVSLFPLARATAKRPGNLAQGINPGTLEVSQIGGEKPINQLEMPLNHTEIHIDISSFVAAATVTQHYHNPFEKPIEAVYTFPLPDDAAVDDMQMKIGDKTVKGLIKRQEEASYLYERARQQGQRTSLLEQERANIFTQSIANIMPGDDIVITIRYVNILHYADGTYELVFPMVVGPRYIPGNITGQSGTGWAADTDVVPDASRITPPVLNSETRTGHDITLSVTLDAGVPIQSLQSPSHQISRNQINSHQYTIEILPTDRLPNKDFVLRYQVAGTVPTIATIAHHDERGGFFTLFIEPQKTVTEEQVVPRELIFILDTSGSMRGVPLTKSKEVMQRLIQGMRPTDRFNVVRFAGDTGTLWEQPQQYSQERANEARYYVSEFQSKGSTEMVGGIIEALSQPAAPGYLRIALLLTDGYVGNEWTIFQAIEREKRGARVFSLGVGSSVNRYLLDRIAEIGRGEAFYVRQDENSDQVIDHLFQRVDRPALAHIEIDWGKLDVTELYPTKIPDLWAGQPIRLHGRYTQGGTDIILVRGQLANQVYEQKVPVHLPQNEPDHDTMATVWARQKVRHLMNQMVLNGRRSTDLVDQITQLALDYRLMTQWTSFIATEDKRVNDDVGQLQTVVQPVNLPEDVSSEGTLSNHVLVENINNHWGEKIFEYSQLRKSRAHRGVLQMPLLNNNAVLKSGKNIVYLGWTTENSSVYYQLTIEGEDGQTWKTTTHSTFVEIKKNQFPFEVGEYLVTVSSFVTDSRTGKPTKKTIEHTLTVDNQGCLNASQTEDFKRFQTGLESRKMDELVKKKLIASWLAKQSSRCWLEAYQHVAGEEGLKEAKQALAYGKIN